jgi:hypothetical protein
VAKKGDLSYIISDEQVKKSRLAQTPEGGSKAEGTKEGAGQSSKIAGFTLKRGMMSPPAVIIR